MNRFPKDIAFCHLLEKVPKRCTATFTCSHLENQHLHLGCSTWVRENSAWS